MDKMATAYKILKKLYNNASFYNHTIELDSYDKNNFVDGEEIHKQLKEIYEDHDKIDQEVEEYFGSIENKKKVIHLCECKKWSLDEFYKNIGNIKPNSDGDISKLIEHDNNVFNELRTKPVKVKLKK